MFIIYQIPTTAICRPPFSQSTLHTLMYSVSATSIVIMVYTTAQQASLLSPHPGQECRIPAPCPLQLAPLATRLTSIAVFMSARLAARHCRKLFRLLSNVEQGKKPVSPHTSQDVRASPRMSALTSAVTPHNDFPARGPHHLDATILHHGPSITDWELYRADRLKPNGQCCLSLDKGCRKARRWQHAWPSSFTRHLKPKPPRTVLSH